MNSGFVDRSELMLKLEDICKEFPRCEISIERVWKQSELPWSIKIRGGECGYGTGNTLPEAIDDALRDFDEHR